MGVPPLFGLCKKLIAENKTVNVILGFNTKSEIFLEDEFRALEDINRIGWIFVNGERHYFKRFHQTLLKTDPAYAKLLIHAHNNILLKNAAYGKHAVGKILTVIGIAGAKAAAKLAVTGTAVKNAALLAMAAALEEKTEEILAANARDMEAAQAKGMRSSMLVRLKLTAERVAGMADGLRSR